MNLEKLHLCCHYKKVINSAITDAFSRLEGHFNDLEERTNN